MISNPTKGYTSQERAHIEMLRKRAERLASEPPHKLEKRIAEEPPIGEKRKRGRPRKTVR